MKQDLERLRSIKSFPSLVKYLRDDLDWPIESDDVENLSFDYQPEELGLDAKTAVKVKEIKQLRPFVTNQPWGIFYVNFEPKHLPIVALRRILRSLVVKKRASANKAQQRAWQQNDLLFISSYGETEEREITFAHFSEDSRMGDLPTLKVLGWNAGNTVLRLEDTHSTLKDKLHWPEDEDDTEEWRERWSSAFKLKYRETVRTSKDLAVKLAELAGDIRARVNDVLEVERERGELRKLYQAFQEALIHDLDEDDFADMYAQTIAYGLLTASISRQSGGLVADNLKDMVPNTNPFLKEPMQTFLTVGGRKNKIDFDELGINEVVELLRHTQMDEVLRDFGAKNPQEDPVIHFYELFLKEYDPEKRMKRGVFYTPRPVVSFIVRSVDEILRTEFGLEDGLADTTTWGEMAARNFVGADLRVRPNEEERPDEQGQTQSSAPTIDFKIPADVSPDEPFVQILDPATGTGTFLVEVIDRIYETLRAKWKKQGMSVPEMYELWNDYVPRHLLPRLHGFELMMAPYAIAHMKIGLKLRETHYSFLSSERARIYLTNTLEEPKDFSSYFEQMAPALAHEAEAANKVKRHAPITVVIGNPPYSVLAANLSEEHRRIIDDYRSVDGEFIQERSMLRLEMHLQDDYVKFVRFTQNRIDNVGAGVIGLITNNGYFDNLTLRGMRFSLLKTFGGLHVVNLHGSKLRQTRQMRDANDQNVFDIEQGVGITVGVRFDGTGNKYYEDVIGTRIEKYNTLQVNTVGSIRKIPIEPKSPNYFFVQRDETYSAEYEAGISLERLLPSSISGIVTAHDHLVVDFDDVSLRRKAKIMRDDGKSDEEVRNLVGVKDNAGWKLARAREALKSSANDNSWYKGVSYRPFDERKINYHPALVWCDRRRVMSHMLNGRNIALSACRQLATLPFEHVFVTRNLQDDCYVSNKTRERSYLFPLYIVHRTQSGTLLSKADQDLAASSPNLSPQVITDLTARLKLRFLPHGLGDLIESLAPEDVFHYIYAVLHSPTYRSRYAEFLKIDFPRIPLTSDAELFRQLCALGADLVALHLLEDDYEAASWNVSESGPPAVAGGSSAENKYPPATAGGTDKSPFAHPITRFKGSGSAEVAKGHPKHKDGNVYINPSLYFEGVPEEVWNFHIGGYQVCEKWLKDRRGRTLTGEDINHYQRVVVALNETIRLMAEIDRVIEEHGGWPLVGSQDTPKAESASALPFA